MCRPATLVLVTLLACAVAAAALPTSNDKRHESDAPATRTPVRYCHFQTPCAWKIYTFTDYAEISLINDYCVCRPSQKCKFYERHSSEGYSEYRCMRG